MRLVETAPIAFQISRTAGLRPMMLPTWNASDACEIRWCRVREVSRDSTARRTTIFRRSMSRGLTR